MMYLNGPFIICFVIAVACAFDVYKRTSFSDNQDWLWTCIYCSKEWKMQTYDENEQLYCPKCGQLNT
jgi:hypothetical protein